VLVHDCIFADNYRNGIAIVAAENLLVENCLITGTAGTAPQAGLLVEPADRPDHLRNVRVRNCRAEGNAGTGFMANLTKHSYLSDPIDVVIEDCEVSESIQPGLRAILIEDIGATGTFEFRRCKVTGTRYAGAKMLWDVSSPVSLIFNGCTWTDVARLDGQRPINFDLIRTDSGRQSGGINFIACRVNNDHHTGMIKLTGDGGPDVPEIMGSISVFGLRPDELNAPSLPNLHVSHEGPRP
jgi:hypothetical protein